jgi:hypothetical protein
MTSLGIGTLRWGLMLLLPTWLATQAHAADAPPPPPSAGPVATAGAPPADTAAAGSPSTAGAPPADAAGAPPATGDSGAYTVRLRSLEKNVNELKEQIFRTKARLNLLKETVLGGVIGASRAVIHHKNEMGSSFRLVKAAFALDGVQIAAKSEGGLADMQEFDVYNGAIQPGSHTLSVALQYQGNGFGVFSYLKGYKFNVKSSHTFVAGESKSTNITVVGYEKGNITTQLSDKPAIDFRVNVMSAGESGTAAAAKK